MATIIRVIAATLLIGVSSNAAADEQRARVNYMLHCQGCHLAGAEGYPGRVPRMRDFVGYFLHSQEGREFLLRVPGVATSSLGNDQLTELMNWMMQTYSAGQMPRDAEPFTVAEVASLRTNPEADPETTRSRILGEIAQSVPALANEMATENE